MKRLCWLGIFICLVFCFIQPCNSQGLKGFKLTNGLTVYIWEDASKPDVFGMVGVNVGAACDPSNLTGLAHYLEHVMFKGTQKIGTTDWEKEKPLYEQIVAKYDERAAETDPVKKETLSKEINKLTVEASKYAVTNEFPALTEELGGKGLNAATSLDYTVYFNSFPPTQVYKWLELNSERFINPVFRAFQSELETVYEEFNREQDAMGQQAYYFMLKNIFPDHPYSRPILGLQEHLKNPRLKGLIDFYDNWYVPENMVLVLVGNIKTNQVLPLIKDRFGRLQSKPSPQKETYPDWELKGRKEVSAKISPYPEVELAFQGVPSGHPDEIVLEICTSILTNSTQTGLLDKLSLDGDVMGAYANQLNYRDRGRILIGGIPYFDVNQRRFNSLKSTEKMLLNEIKKLQNGEIEEWLLNSIKGSMIRHFDLSFESSETKANRIVNAFIYKEDIGNILNYKEKVASITLEQVKEVAKKYFTNDYLVLQLQEGKAAKVTKLDKPKYDPITPQRGAKSAYAQYFEKLPVKKEAPTFCNFDEVQIRKVNERSKLFYTPNKENNIFTLILKYGVGTEQMPNLKYAAQLMNNAGIMGQYDAQQLKQEFSRLNASCRFNVDDNYLYVIMEGYENNLQESCNLLTRQILMPKLEDKQLNNMLGNEIQTRRMEEENVNVLNNAAFQYLRYHDKSEYIDRPSIEKLVELTISDLTGEFSRATDYEAEIHYMGALPFEDVYSVLSKNLPLKAQEKATNSPVVKDRVKYTENTIYFLPENDAQQSGIYFFVEGKPYDRKEEVIYDAFNQYFDGGFNGLVMQEVREFRSMAYTAAGNVITPVLPGKDICFWGYVGTQGDKSVEAIELYMSLLKEMPEYSERIDNIKEFLTQMVITDKPDFRSASMTYEAWKRLGYTEDPAKEKLPMIQKLTFEDILNFYKNNIKDKVIAIAVVGDPKRIDLKQLEKYGKVIKLSKSKVFSSR